MRFRRTILAVGAALLSACTQQHPTPPEEVRPVHVIVVGRSAGSVGAVYSGEVRARYEGRLGFPTSGKVMA